MAVTPRSESEPASSMRNNDHGPLRSSTEGVPPPSATTVIAVCATAPGHCTVVGETFGGGGAGGGVLPGKGLGAVGAGTDGAETTVPPVSNLATAPVRTGGRIANVTTGALPPVWKKASRISAAR